jgi:recombination protein RecT
MSTQQLKTITTGQPARRPANFPAMLEQYKGEVARALPKHLNPDNMLRVALTAFRMNPKLEECQPASVFAAVVQASQLGLRPNMLGECYLIPYKDQCTLQIGYQGLLELVRRSGLVDSIGCYIVHERDTYEVNFGTEPGITHRPYLDGDRGPAKFGYAVAKLKGGGTHVEVMSIAEINEIRDRSQNVRNAKKYGKPTPWDTDYEEMARKTLARRICKWLPKSNELAQALTLSDAADRDAQRLNIDDAINGTFTAPTVIDGEIGPTGEAGPVGPPDGPALAGQAGSLPSDPSGPEARALDAKAARD